MTTMETLHDTSEYLLLLRGTRFEDTLSPQEMQEAMSRFAGWFERLTHEGKLRAGQPLDHGGRVITGRKARAVADGPFAESKEAVGGYVLLAARGLDEAVALAEECPLLDYGATVEVRPVLAQCESMRRANVSVVNGSRLHA